MKKPLVRKQKRRGFTLIEIMVVVVILGILAATIIPKFMTTKHDAKISAAKSSIANWSLLWKDSTYTWTGTPPPKKD